MGTCAVTSVQSHTQSSLIAALPDQVSKNLSFNQSTGQHPHQVTEAKGHVPACKSSIFLLLLSFYLLGFLIHGHKAEFI